VGVDLCEWRYTVDTDCCVQCTVHCEQFTVRCALCNVLCVQWTVRCEQCTVNCEQCTDCCVQCTEHFVQCQKVNNFAVDWLLPFNEDYAALKYLFIFLEGKCGNIWIQLRPLNAIILPLSTDGGQWETEQLTMIHSAGVELLTGIYSGHFWDWTLSYGKKSRAKITWLIGWHWWFFGRWLIHWASEWMSDVCFCLFVLLFGRKLRLHIYCVKHYKTDSAWIKLFENFSISSSVYAYWRVWWACFVSLFSKISNLHNSKTSQNDIWQPVNDAQAQHNVSKLCIHMKLAVKDSYRC